MSLPCLVTEAVVVRAVPAKVNPLVPAAVAGLFPVLLNVLKGKKFAASVVEYPVYHNLNTSFVAELCEMTEAFIGAETAVYEAVVTGVVSMGGGLKEWSDVKCGAA